MLVIRKKKLEMLSCHSREKKRVRGSDALGQILFLVLHTNFIFPFFCPVTFLADGVDGSTEETRSRISEFSDSICLSSGGRPWGIFPSKAISLLNNRSSLTQFQKWSATCTNRWRCPIKSQVSLNSDLVRSERCGEDEAYCQNNLLEMDYVK